MNLLMNRYKYSGSITSSVEFEYFPFPVKEYSRMQLENVLLPCQPSMLFVEHDRAFREKKATKIIEF